MVPMTDSAERMIDLARADAGARGQSTTTVRNVVLAALDLGPAGPLGAVFGSSRLAMRLRSEAESAAPPRRRVSMPTLVPVSDGLERTLAGQGGGRLGLRELLALCLGRTVSDVLGEFEVRLDDALELAEDDTVVAPERVPEGRAAAPSEAAGQSVLDRFGRDLTALARAGKLSPAIGRDDEVGLMCGAMLRMYKNNPLLIGEPGTGKTALVEHFALAACNGELGPHFTDLRVVEVDLPGMVAGTRFRGDFEERVKGLLDEVRASEGAVVPFIDELHLIMGAGSTSGSMDAGNILKPALARGELRLIGATTPAEYRATIERDGAMARRFGNIRVEEPDLASAILITQGVGRRIAAFHGVELSDALCERAVHLADRYIRDRAFPDKSIMILDEAAAMHRARSSQAAEPATDDPAVLTVADIEDAVERVTGVPASRLSQGAAERLSLVEQRLGERIIGQDGAADAVLGVLKRRAAGLAPDDRPIGSFLFLGPSGVGKTELARVVAEEYFDSPHALNRFDMSEYSDRSGSASLLGAPAGTVSSERGGRLTNALRDNPYGVYLFDEIEKADRSTMNIFLQMLDAGRLTGRDGITVDCTHAVIVFTSNLGNADVIARGPGIDEAEQLDLHMQAARRELPPELFRRFDEVVPFGPLGHESCRGIARLQLDGLARRFERAHGAQLTFTDGLAEAIAERGVSPLYGARNIRYETERLVEQPLVEWILRQQQPLPSIRARWGDERAVFEREEPNR